jgi:nucleoside-diphosphate-sugar epimerase
MKVFVTGATGYIGSALTKELVAHGHTVLGLAHSETSVSKLEALGAEVHHGDLKDLDSLRNGAAAADAVVHCAYDHSAFTGNPGHVDPEAAPRLDNAVVEAIGEVLVGTNKPFVITSSSLLLAGLGSTEDIASINHGFSPLRSKSEHIAIDLATKGVRSGVIRLPPTVHGGNMNYLSFIRMITTAASKNGYAAYVGDGTTRWPAVNVYDAVALYRLILEAGVAGRCYHAIADTGNSMFSIATAISEHLQIPVKSIPLEEAVPTFGFIGVLMDPGYDNPMSADRTQEWTGWKPAHPSILENLKAGNKAYY